MDSKKVLAEGTFYRKIILLDISSAMNFTIRSTFISKETRNGSFHGSTSSEYNAAFLCKGQVTSLLIVVYLIEQDNTPIRVWREREKKKSKKGSIRAVVARGIFVEKFDDASGRAEEMYRSAQKKLESVFDNVYSRMQAKFVLLDIIDLWISQMYIPETKGRKY